MFSHHCEGPVATSYFPGVLGNLPTACLVMPFFFFYSIFKLYSTCTTQNTVLTAYFSLPILPHSSVWLKEQLEISASQYSYEKGEFKLQKKLGANTQIPTFQMLFPAETELGFSSNSRNSEHMYLPIHNSMMRDR